jgi:transcription elongation GreA/GreB family factor
MNSQNILPRNRSGEGRPGNCQNPAAFFHRSNFRRLSMNKRALIQKIVAKLTSELAVYFRAAQASRAEATHEQSKAESKYDTRGLEASYLARGQSKQAMELETSIAEFEKMEARSFTAGEGIAVGALVELAMGGETSFYFIGPRAGGTEVVQDKKEVLVITPQSPLGAQLLERKQGDQPQLLLAGKKQAARIVSVE